LDNIANIIYSIAACFGLAGMVLALLRLAKGPTPADRVVALDVMTIISISLIVFIATMAGRIIYIDVALVYALISFIGVVAVARYLERGL
jgi:multicomponent Na+:H+ antiporter subunit F